MLHGIHKQLLLALAAAASLSLSPSALADETIKLGVVGENNEQWEYVADQLKKEGVTLELVKFADYTLPNRALNDGEINLNTFQHIAFLRHQNKENGYKLAALAPTIIAPLSVFSQKIKSLDELKDGDTIAIPNDPTNGGRALKLFETAGIIKVDPKKGFVPEVRDITDNPRHIKFYEVDAANTVSLLPDVAAAVVNSNYAVDNNLIPQRDAIYIEKQGEGDENPFVNIIAVREDDKGNPLYQKLLKAYQTKEVAEIILRVFKGAQIPVFKY
ncbi:MAG: methionine ABC transporter substrate-binding protein [Succinivibrionaceae bacterium]|nr:methionine ABC transporter substrate-binding protein [Succinivibrionaceae bacterium]